MSQESSWSWIQDSITEDLIEDLIEDLCARVFVILAQLIGLTSLIFVGIWMGSYAGGFAWQSDPDLEFNLHPLLMTIGIIFLYGNSILVYRVFSDVQKLKVKILHATLLALSLIIGSVGLKAVFDSHNLAKPKPHANLQSLHSWVGLGIVILFGLQWLCGFISFLYPKLSKEARSFYLPTHKFWGITIFFLAVANVLMGTMEYATELNAFSTYKSHGIIVNVFGICIILFAILIIYILTERSFERVKPDGDDDHITLMNVRNGLNDDESRTPLMDE
ncbi:unnamed protein product [Didymodactylos carnosus]|uniref:Cytochrome b561 domain-containing protein n=1 Tax=Didymodactylos carnosus TaxID=1234261 RepID=A0A8S2E4D4_9BILA|nr:unnamed protein product [Didymodactylos carnosus]CAF3842069.1 unnamed protein product [Didymodactylos carnosus]